MKKSSFNTESEKPRFMHKPNPLVPHSWQIFMQRPGREDYEPVGSYTLLDLNEPIDITEKKLFNLLGIMNGKPRLIDFENLTDTRTLFTLVPSSPESNEEKVVYRTYDGKGVSKENAVLVLEKGVLDES